MSTTDTPALHVVKRSKRYVDILLYGKPYRINSCLEWYVPSQHPTLGLLWMPAVANFAPEGWTLSMMHDTAMALTVPGSCKWSPQEFRYRFA